MDQKSNRLQRVGTVFAIAFGVWGAGLSTWQEFRTHEKEKTILYTQLTVSRPQYVERAKGRPATFTLNVHNSGKIPVTLLPAVSFVAFNPASGFSSTFKGQFEIESTYSLPKTLLPGEKAAAIAVAPDSNTVFGPNMQYVVLVQAVDHKLYYSENMVGPIKTAEAFDALQENVRYQSKVEFGSKPALVLSH